MVIKAINSDLYTPQCNMSSQQYRRDDNETYRTKHEHWRGCELAGTVRCSPSCAGDRQAGPRHRSRNIAGRRAGPGRLLERKTRIRGLLARDRQADRARRIHPRSGSTPRNIRPSRAGPRTSPFRIPSSASRASDGAEKHPSETRQWGRPAGRPSSLWGRPRNSARPSNPPTSRDRSHDQHNRVYY